MTKLRRAVITLAVVLVGGATLSAQNLVTNPDFNTDATGWTPTSAEMSITWAALDAYGSGTSGSGLVTNSFSTAANAGVTQCINTPLTDGASYDVGAWIRVPSGQTGTGAAGLFAWFHSGAACGGAQIGTLSVSYLPPPTDSWTLSTATGAAPAGTQSVTIYLNVNKMSDAGTLGAYFDGVRFGPNPTTPVGAATFTAE